MGIRQLMSDAPRPPLVRLERTIASRAANPNQKSYTSKLLAGGVPKIGAKVTEEAAEVVEAAGEPGDAGKEHFTREVCDLFYHLLVLMQFRDCTLADVEAELARRFGVSGLAEKASRPPKETGSEEAPTEPEAPAEPKKPATKKKAPPKKAAAKPKIKKAKRKPKRK